MNTPALDVAAWSSRWRHRSPGDKVLLGLGLICCALLLPVWPASPLVTLVAAVLVMGPAGVSVRSLVLAARAPLAFTILGAVGIAITWRTAPGGGIRPTVTGSSLAAATETAAHAIAGTSAMLLVAATTPMSDLLEWARRRGMPDALIDVAGLIYRLLFVLLRASRQIHAAQTARLGYATRRAALRSAALLTAAILTRAWDRARRLDDGLVGRGFEGPLPVIDDARPSSVRFLAASCLLLAAVAAVSLLAR